jgi:hypothetical protein
MITENGDNFPSTRTLHMAIDSSANAGGEPSANRTGRRQMAQITSMPLETTTAPSTEPSIAAVGVRPATKSDLVLNLLRRAHGASLSEISAATGWQAHSVRGFLSGTVRKKLGLNLVSVITGDGVRRYTTGEAAASVEPALPIDLPAFGSFRGAAAVEQADATQEA